MAEERRECKTLAESDVKDKKGSESTMTGEIELLGEWWLPHKPEEKFNGLLRYNQDNDIELELIGSFGDLKDVASMDEKRYEIIQGFTTKGKRVTLVDCLQISFNISMPGMITEKYCANAVIIGCYFDSVDSISFRSIKISYENLELWLSQPSYKITQYEKAKKITVDYSLPETVQGMMKDIQVSIEYTSRTHGKLFSQFTIEQTGWVKFEKVDANLDFFDVNRLIVNFSNLLTLSSGVYIDPIIIKASTEADKNIELIFIRKLKKNRRQFKKHDFIFSFHEIQSDFQDFLNIWNVKHEKLEPVVNYFVDAHKQEVYSPVSFLKLVQALEAFSRRLRQNWVEEQEIHLNRIQQVLSVIDNVENKEWLSNTLKYVNEPSLGTRLKGIFRETNFLLNMNSSRISSYVYKVVETRNYYTHFDESKKDKILDIHEMFYLGKYFILMLRSLLLIELGFSNEYVKNNINKKGEIQNIRKGLGL